MLEQTPFHEDAKSARAWLVQWIEEIPDISVKVCTGPLFTLLDTKKNYASELFFQSLFSSTTFIIQNPNKAQDDTAVYLAGVEGTLRMYENLLKEKPKARHKILDELQQKRDKGELDDYIRQLAPCNSTE